MKLIFIGGTRFVGLAILERALERGHEATVVHRGNTGLPERLKGRVTEVLGDRADIQSLIPSGSWDAVIDSSSYFPRPTRVSAQHFKDKAPQYVYVSTVSVYPLGTPTPYREDADLGTPDADWDAVEVTPENYGPLKLASEQVVREVYDDQSLIVRPTIVTGSSDYTDRFSYWALKLSGVTGQQQVLVPKEQGRLVQQIDSDDLAAFTLNLCEAGATGVYNAAGPSSQFTFGDMIRALVGPNSPEIVEVDRERLESNGVRPWIDLPIWLPDDHEYSKETADCAKSVAAGLKFSSILETATKVVEERKKTGDFSLKTGLSLDRELAILDQLK